MITVDDQKMSIMIYSLGPLVIRDDCIKFENNKYNNKYSKIMV
jgi:hypothetical protein